MKVSKNILVIKSLSIKSQKTDTIDKAIGELQAEIKFHCPVTGNHFRSTVINATSYGKSEKEIFTNLVDNLIFGNVYFENRYYQANIGCDALSENIESLDVQIQEPYKSLIKNYLLSNNEHYLKIIQKKLVRKL